MLMVHITWPPHFLECFLCSWTHYAAPSSKLSWPCRVKRFWLQVDCLSKGNFLEMKMVHSSSDHGVFVWDQNNFQTIITLAMDDCLVCSPFMDPFFYLKAKLKEMFYSLPLMTSWSSWILISFSTVGTYFSWSDSEPPIIFTVISVYWTSWIGKKSKCMLKELW